MSKVAKLMNEKIAKVREVVHGVSSNDIILALHSFDLNVERTIQAFCEDGASEVLDDWVRPAGGASKNKKKKKKNKQTTVEHAASAVTSATPFPSKVAKAPSTHENKPAVVPPTPQQEKGFPSDEWVIRSLVSIVNCPKVPSPRPGSNRQSSD